MDVAWIAAVPDPATAWPRAIRHPPRRPPFPRAISPLDVSIASAAALNREGPLHKERGGSRGVRPAAGSAAHRPPSVAATACVRMGDAIGEETLCKTRAFIRRERARRSTR
jgi:hypothetical protein